MKATRPFEYICFFPTDLPTKEGDAYMHLFVDVYSKFLFNTGTELKHDDATILKHISLAMQNEHFSKRAKKGFTLVLHKFAHLESEINDIIKPHGGKFIIDDPWVAIEFMPVMESLYTSISRNLKK